MPALRRSPIYPFFIPQLGLGNRTVKMKNPLQFAAGVQNEWIRVSAESLLPCALLVAVRLEPLPALVLRHLKPTFLFQITHG